MTRTLVAALLAGTLMVSGLVSVAPMEAHAGSFWNKNALQGKRYLDGVIAYRDKNFGEALAIFARLHAKTNKTADDYGKITYYLAITHAQRGELKEARRYYEELVNLKPDSQEAKLAMQGLKYLPAMETEKNTLDTPPKLLTTVQEKSPETPIDARAVATPVKPAAAAAASTSAAVSVPKLRPPADLSKLEPPAYQAVSKLQPMPSMPIKQPVQTTTPENTVQIKPEETTSAYLHPANTRIVHDEPITPDKQSTEDIPQPQQSSAQPATPPRPISPQDMMAFQMMMMMMNQNNGGGNNGMGMTGNPYANPMNNPQVNPMATPQWLNQMMQSQGSTPQGPPQPQAQPQQQRSQYQNTIDPQMFSTMMMNQMMNNLDFSGNNKN